MRRGESLGSRTSVVELDGPETPSPGLPHFPLFSPNLTLLLVLPLDKIWYPIFYPDDLWLQRKSVKRAGRAKEGGKGGWDVRDHSRTLLQMPQTTMYNVTSFMEFFLHFGRKFGMGKVSILVSIPLGNGVYMWVLVLMGKSCHV